MPLSIARKHCLCAFCAFNCAPENGFIVEIHHLCILITGKRFITMAFTTYHAYML